MDDDLNSPGRQRRQFGAEELLALGVFLVLSIVVACLFAPSHTLDDWSNIVRIVGYFTSRD